MRETLPNVLVDEHVPAMFLMGFSVILTALVLTLVGIAIAQERARRAGIYRKYVAANDSPNHRRTLDPN